MDAIFGASPLEGNTSRERSIYINETRRANYSTVLTGPPLTLRKPIMFFEVDACAVHFLHNNALIITMHISNCQVSTILIYNRNIVNILYGGALDRMEDTSEAA